MELLEVLAQLWGWGPPDWRDLTWREVEHFAERALAIRKSMITPTGA